MAALWGGELAMVVGLVAFPLATGIAYAGGRHRARGAAASWVGVLIFSALVFGLLSAGYTEGALTTYDWGAVVRFVWLPAAGGILIGAVAGWRAGAGRAVA